MFVYFSVFKDDETAQRMFETSFLLRVDSFLTIHQDWRKKHPTPEFKDKKSMTTFGDPEKKLAGGFWWVPAALFGFADSVVEDAPIET